MPRGRYLSGCADDKDWLPRDVITLVKFRQLQGKQGAEALLAQTNDAAFELS